MLSPNKNPTTQRSSRRPESSSSTTNNTTNNNTGSINSIIINNSNNKKSFGRKSTCCIWVFMAFLLILHGAILIVMTQRVHSEDNNNQHHLIHHHHHNSSNRLASSRASKRFNSHESNNDIIPFGDVDVGAKPGVRLDDAQHAHPTPDHILKAYLEPLNFDEWEVKPLPVRAKARKDNLREVSYPHLNSCTKLPQQWPVDDTPTDVDPFLPWIHDVFPTADGKYIQFVAQNKRRCKTGRQEYHIMMHMNPQLSLFQHVPIQRLQEETKHDDNKNQTTTMTTRYRLVPHEQADGDGIATRFICRFKPGMEETLSVYNFDYDWTSYRKRYPVTFDKNNTGVYSLHTSQLTFQCPVPQHLQGIVRTGASVKDNDWASLFVDLIPIRTPPRYGDPRQFLAPWYSEFQIPKKEDRFDPVAAWGDKHILPRIEDSGRWENIPICKPSLMTYEGQKESDLPPPPTVATTKIPKKHKLVSCIWASAGYATRGNRFAIHDGQRRLLEWILYNKIIGFDHFYLYDNTGAFRNDTSLKPIADLFSGEVTYIPWPSKVCNNNPGTASSKGERSSQYAAETSCRLRFGPHVEWIGQFDIDEYFVPMGEHKTALTLLDKLDKDDWRILTFASWRAWPRWALIEEPVPINNSRYCWNKEPCFDLRIPKNTTMLQAYNCDRQLPGQKKDKMPAEKQIYRADYVTQHFVHYSTATVLSAMNRSEYTKQGLPWYRAGFPDKRQRNANELEEGLMIHAKAVAHQDTTGWERVCHVDSVRNRPKNSKELCRLGVPWPKEAELAKSSSTKEGWAHNCYVNEKVEKLFVPQLEKALQEYAHVFDAK